MRCSRAGSKERAAVPVAVQHQPPRNHFWGEKGSDGQTPRGTSRRPAWRVPVASRLECLCRTGRFKGSSCCASCGVSVKLWSTGMCSVGEEKCNKKYFSQKSPFFQTLSGELPKWICKWLPASKQVKVLLKSLKLSGAFPFLPVFFFEITICLFVLLFDFSLLSGLS